MKREKFWEVISGLFLLSAFIIWTVLICCVDVRPIGPQGSTVGFAAINEWFHGFTGVHMVLYTLSDWLSILPVGIVIGFALLGLNQWIKRRSIRMVDRSILVLGIFYSAVIIGYQFFEEFVVNYRPVLIDGILEASYPSSTTVLVICVMLTALIQIKDRIEHRVLEICVTFALVVFTIFMVVCRLVSGVHWLSDIIGGVLLSAGLVKLYHALC